MSLDLIQTYKPEIVKMMKSVLFSPESQAQLTAFQGSLNSLIGQIHACESENQTLGQKYNKLMNELYSGVMGENLSQINMVASQSTALDARVQGLINQLFQLEHQIIDFLTKGAADTAAYAIYFSVDSGSGTTVMRGEIKSEDLYNSGKMTITNSGISLMHHNVVDLFKTQGSVSELTPAQMTKYAELAQTAIENMKDALAQLRKELEDVSKRKRREHLGGALWSKYKNLQRLVGSEYQEQGLQAAYLYGIMKNADHYTSLRGSFMNRGHIYEALERFVQGSTGSLSELLGESIGHDPWWTQGDVGNIQVKSLVGKQDRYESSVKVASMESILKVAQMLQELLNARKQDLSQLDTRVTAALDAQISGQADHSGEMINDVVAKLIAQLHVGAG